jgi:hypothetical protein
MEENKKEMIDKIYIVTAGTYSDYGIEKCFLNKADAEDYAKKIDDAKVEEHDLFNDKIIMRQYWTYDLYLCGEYINWNKNHNLFEEVSENKRSEIIKENISVWKMTEKELNKYYEKHMYRYNDKFNYDYQIATVTSYVSDDHAKKLANDAWHEWLRRVI